MSMRRSIVVADAARARIYTYEFINEPGNPHELLREERDLIDSARRKRPSELFSDNSGANHSGTRGYAFDDHRQAHLDNMDVDFARQIVGELELLVTERDSHDVIVIASPRMLGQLRDHLGALRRPGLTIEELDHDLTKLTTPQLRNRLAELKLLPPMVSRSSPARR